MADESRHFSVPEMLKLGAEPGLLIATFKHAYAYSAARNGALTLVVDHDRGISHSLEASLPCCGRSSARHKTL